jgi:hypothetical protein
VGGRLKVRVAEHRSELKAFEIPRPRSCIVWTLGVGADWVSSLDIRPGGIN